MIVVNSCRGFIFCQRKNLPVPLLSCKTIMSSSTSGGGRKDVGVGATPTMQTMGWDERTRPINRADMIAFLSDPNSTSEEEKWLVYKLSGLATFTIGMGGSMGWMGSGLLPWRWLKRQPLPYQQTVLFCRSFFVLMGMSIPYVLVQQYATKRLLNLPADSVLGFNVRRFMVTQQSTTLFNRPAVREITKAEQQQMAEADLEFTKASQKIAPGARDVNALLAQQQLTPIAQTGYSQPPPKS